MKARKLFVLSTMVLTLALVAGLVVAQDDQKQMEAWMKAASPGDNHVYLKDLEGTWKVKISSWMAPGTEPVTSEGKSEIEVVLDGRYAMEKMTSTMMGMPYTGMGMVGYDNVVNKHTVVWFDNMSTNVTYATGVCNGDDCNVIETAATMNMPGGGTVDIRMVSKRVDDNKRVFEMYSTIPGTDNEFKNMEIVYTR